VGDFLPKIDWHYYIILYYYIITPIGKNFVSCCQFFSLPAIVPDKYNALGYKQILVKARGWTRFVKAPICIIIQLFELIMIRNGVYITVLSYR